jgi:hypothetical protein
LGVIEVFLDVESEHREQLESQLQKQFAALETLRVETKTQPVEPGTLAIPAHEVVAFILKHREEIVEAAKWLPFAKAVVNIVRFVLDNVGLGKGKQKHIIVKVLNCSIALPASEEIQKRFLECVAAAGKTRSGVIAAKKDEPKRSNGDRKKKK